MSDRPDFSAYLKSVSPGGDPRALLDMIGAEKQAAATETMDLAGAVAAAYSGQEMSDAQIYATEALIHPEIRPVFDVLQDSYQPVTHPLWLHLNGQDLKTRIETAIRASGRIELKTGSARYGGTGFVVGDGLLMTNRHVAELFALGLGDKDIVFKPDFDPGFDLKRERDGKSQRLKVRHVRLIHPYWDCAVLEVEGLPKTAGKLCLSAEPIAALANREVVLVGYPAQDPRNPLDEQDDLLDGVFRIKRLAPGKLSAPMGAASFGKLVMALGHDASTLGGNSGSALFDFRSGKVLGLHFGGAYKIRNTAVAAADLAADLHMHDAGVNFEGARPSAAPSWSGWWQRSFAGEAPAAEATATNAVARPAQPQGVVSSVGGDGAVILTIPLQITVQLGTQVLAGAAAGATTEAMAEPWRDRDYSHRNGYKANFLGDAKELAVPPPVPQDPAVLARTKTGEAALIYQNFSIAMHAERRLALFVASNVTGEPELRRPDPQAIYTRKALSGLGESDQERWFLDDRMEERFQVPDYFYTRDGGNFDKGHIARRDDVAFGKTFEDLRRANGDSYHVTNCSPQIEGFNRSASGEDNWGDFENVVLSQARSERLCVFAGPVLDAEDSWFLGKAAPRQKMMLRVPTRFWKVVVARAEEKLAVYALLLEQDLSDMQKAAAPQDGTEFVLPEAFEKSLVRLKHIEGWTGLTFDKSLHDADQYFSDRGVAAAVLAGAVRRSRKKKATA
ncbi:DNA/RNA non-specific endonuclease [Bosea sp. LjRoot237]|uniref:DNA/RNA non-specific endonuclease n=1 Tax=Bosea sp. LjRoot237 TaxID=3342292 RepID=UPI003ED0EBCF